MFMSDVSIIVRKMRTFAERNQACLGIGFPEQLVLMHLRAHGSSNQESIATLLDIDKGAVAKTIAKLEDKGLVTRKVNPENRREKLVSTKPAAEDVLETMRSNYQDFEQRMFEGLSNEEQQLMIELVGRVARNISEI